MSAAALRTMFQAIDASDWAAFPEVYHADVVYERPGYPPLRGLDEVTRFYEKDRRIAGGTHHVDGIVIDGDQGACWGTLTGVLNDGAEINVTFADIYRFADGRIVSRRSYFFTPLV